MQKVNQLPIHAFKKQIISIISSQRVVIISGKTGCGKSTQVPQYIFHEYPQSKIAVCQPRRIAAQSLAIRVSQQNGTRLGKQIGYHIGMQSQASDKTRLIYMTYGILIQKLLYDENIPYTHIILDEIHERSIEMDFTCIALKKILEDKNSKTKLIIMSATINAQDFSEYFAINPQTNKFIKPELTFYQEIKQNKRGRGDRRNEQSNPISTVKRQFIEKQKYVKAKCIQLNVGTPFKIDQLFLQQFSAEEASYSIDIDTKVDDRIFEIAISLIQKEKKKKAIGDILVFIPGIFEIKKMKTMIQAKMPEQSQKIIEVHSAFSQDLIHRLFNANNPNKIILATNMGESSITLPECKIVIDFCLTRKNYSNKLTGFSRFQTRLASKSSLSQRAGRVGRVSDGTVYRLISKKTYNELKEFDIPEIKCVSLQMLILKAKQIDKTYKTNIFQDPYELLLNILEPPQIGQIQYAIDCLINQDALQYEEPEPSCKQKGTKFLGKNLLITKIGQFMVSMPCELRVSKMILVSIKLGIPGTIIDIASQFICQKDFFCHEQKRDNIEQFMHSLVGYDEGKCNDYLLRQRIFNHWRQQFYIDHKRKGLDILFKRKKQSENQASKKMQEKTGDSPKKEKSKHGQKEYIEALNWASEDYQGESQNFEQNSNKRFYQTQNRLMKNPLELQQELYQMNKIVQEFCKKYYRQEEKHWCLSRGIYPTTMRQILRISQNLRARLKQLDIKVPLQSQKKVNNELIIISLVFAFKQTDCNIQWKYQSKKQRADLKNMVNFNIPNNCKINQSEIRDFVNPEKQPTVTFQNNKKFVKIVGNFQTIKKFLLPSQYSKARIDKCSNIFKLLSKEKVYYSFQPIIMNQSKRVTVLNQSINKVIMHRSSFNQYLITNTIQQSKGNNFIKACALINQITFYLISILVRKDVSLRLHKTKEFYEAVEIDSKYCRTLPFQIRQKQIEKILKYRNILRRQNSTDVASESEIMKPQQVEELLGFFGSVQPLKQVGEWQRYFLKFQDQNRQNKQTNLIKENLNDENSKLTFQIDKLPKLKQPLIDFRKRYKQWKKQYFQQFSNDIRIHTIDLPYFICKQCYPKRITKIQEFKYFDFAKKMIDFNCYRMDHNLKQEKLYCLMNHRIGVLHSEDWALLDQENVLVYIPFDCVEKFSSSEIRIREKIDNMFNQGKQQLNRRRNQKEFIQCKICVQIDDYDQLKRTVFDREQLGNKFWQTVQKHLLDKKHIAKLDKFKQL